MTWLGEFSERKELEKKAKQEGRLPPGQSLTLKWPVLHAGRCRGLILQNGISKWMA